MARDSRSFWAKLDWWGKLELLGIGALLAFCAISAVNPVLADAIVFKIEMLLRGW